MTLCYFLITDAVEMSEEGNHILCFKSSTKILILLLNCRSYGFDPLKLGEDPSALRWCVGALCIC